MHDSAQTDQQIPMEWTGHVFRIPSIRLMLVNGSEKLLLPFVQSIPERIKITYADGGDASEHSASK